MILLKKCPACESNKLNLFMVCKDFTVSQENFNIVSCETCGFKFTNPMPSKNGIGKYYDSNKYISHTQIAKKVCLIFYINQLEGLQ